MCRSRTAASPLPYAQTLATHPVFNFIERSFGETRRRAKVIGRLPGESSCLSLVWAVLDRASKGWRGLTMPPKALRRLQDLRRELLAQPPGHNGNEEVIAETVTAAA